MVAVRQHADRHADQRQRHDRLAAHGVHVGDRVGGGDAAEVVGIVDDRHEEIGGGDQRLLVVELVDGCVVGGFDAHQQLGWQRHAGRALQDLGQHAGRDLAAAAATVRQRSEAGLGSCGSGKVQWRIHDGSCSSWRSWSNAARSALGVEQRRAQRALCAQALQQAGAGSFAGWAWPSRQRSSRAASAACVPGREIAFVVRAQHSHVARDARGQHRRAAAHGFHDDVRAAFQRAGVHQHMRALDRLPGLRVRQGAQPAVAGALCGGGLGLLPPRAGSVGRRRCGRCGCRPVPLSSALPRTGSAGLHGPQVAHHHGAAGAPRSCRAARRAGVDWKITRALPRCLRGSAVGAAVPAAPPAAAPACQRALRLRVVGDVLVQVGAGQHHRQPTAGVRLRPRRESRPRSAARAAPACTSSPAPCPSGQCCDDARSPVGAQQLPPALRGPPIAVVGIGQRRAYDDDRWTRTSRGYSAPRTAHAQPGESRGGRARTRSWPRASAPWPGRRLRGALAARRSAGALCARRSIRRCGNWATSAGSRSGGSRATASATLGGAQCDPRTRGRPSLLRGADALYDSSRVAHRSALGTAAAGCGCHAPVPGGEPLRRRWTLLDELPRNPGDDALYFFRLVALHEEMHAEAACYMAHAWASPWRPGCRLRRHECRRQPNWKCLRRHSGWATTGRASPSTTSWVRTKCTLDAFRIDAQPVTWARFLPLSRRAAMRSSWWWDGRPGWAWLAAIACLRRAPRWQQARGGRWPRADGGRAPERSRSAGLVPLGGTPPARPRPSGSARPLTRAGFRWGQVWEWTASAFQPYPGFAPHPYRDYSAPWFGTPQRAARRIPATSPALAHPRYRNFFEPHRSDMFAGFRSVPCPGQPCRTGV